MLQNVNLFFLSNLADTLCFLGLIVAFRSEIAVQIWPYLRVKSQGAVKKREYAFAYTSLPRLGRRDYSLNAEVDTRDKVVRSKED